MFRNKLAHATSACCKAAMALMIFAPGAHAQDGALGSEALGERTVTATLSNSPTGCHPGPNEVAFYEHKDFGGRCFLSSKGWVPILGNSGRDWSGVSSVRVGSNVQVVLCSKERFKGACTLADHDISFLGQVAVGNDHLTSFYVRGPISCLPGRNQAAVYSGIAFSGQCVTLDRGEYTDNSRFAFHDGIASILQNTPGENGGIELCSKENYKGQCVRLLASADASLQDDKVGIGGTSSIKVFPPLPKCTGSILPLRPSAFPVQSISTSASYENCSAYASIVLTIHQDRPWWFDKTLTKIVTPSGNGQDLQPSGSLGATYQCESGIYGIKLYAKLRARKGSMAKDLAETPHEPILCGVPSSL